MVGDERARPRGRQDHGGLNPQQREELDRLERISQPSDWQRGSLSALHLNANGPEKDRIRALRERWAKP